MNSIEQKLRKDIAQAVELITAASHAVAISSLSEAFGMSRSKPPSNRKATSIQSKPPRRCKKEMEQLKQSLCDAIDETPGQTMAELKSQLGCTRKDLTLPMAKLKSEERVKSVGHRNTMRYFPLDAQINE